MTEESEGDRLYALSLEEFTQARDALATRLRSAGDAAAAAEVRALRKPTTPAWAVNQLARRQRPLIEELIAASERLRAAQQELLAGGPAQVVWEATLAERDLIARLVHEAERILQGQNYGATRATLDRISDTLAAAAADAAGQALLRRGTLTAEMRRAGFGELLETGPVDAKPRAAPAKRPPAKAKPAARPAGKPTPKASLDAEREAVRLARAADKAEEDAERFGRAAERAGVAADVARKRLQIAAREAAKARADATDASKRAKAARREAERGEAKSGKLRRR